MFWPSGHRVAAPPMASGLILPIYYCQRAMFQLPGWQRGDEYGWMLEPRRQELTIFGLGGTISTPPEGLEAEVMVVRGFDELTSRQSEVHCHIVIFVEV